MVIGADVTHGLNGLSVAGVVGSTDRREVWCGLKLMLRTWSFHLAIRHFYSRWVSLSIPFANRPSFFKHSDAEGATPSEEKKRPPKITQKQPQSLNNDPQTYETTLKNHRKNLQRKPRRKSIQNVLKNVWPCQELRQLLCHSSRSKSYGSEPREDPLATEWGEDCGAELNGRGAVAYRGAIASFKLDFGWFWMFMWRES